MKYLVCITHQVIFLYLPIHLAVSLHNFPQIPCIVRGSAVVCCARSKTHTYIIQDPLSVIYFNEITRPSLISIRTPAENSIRRPPKLSRNNKIEDPSSICVHMVCIVNKKIKLPHFID